MPAGEACAHPRALLPPTPLRSAATVCLQARQDAEMYERMTAAAGVGSRGHHVWAPTAAAQRQECGGEPSSRLAVGPCRLSGCALWLWRCGKHKQMRSTGSRCYCDRSPPAPRRIMCARRMFLIL